MKSKTRPAGASRTFAAFISAARCLAVPAVTSSTAAASTTGFLLDLLGSACVQTSHQGSEGLCQSPVTTGCTLAVQAQVGLLDLQLSEDAPENTLTQAQLKFFGVQAVLSLLLRLRSSIAARRC